LCPKPTEANHDESRFHHDALGREDPGRSLNAVNDVRGWWSEQIDGSTDTFGAAFTYGYEDVHRSTMKIIEFIPGHKVVWLVLDNVFNFVEDKTEWTGTKVVFDIFEKDGNTQLRFTHEGLVPAYECFDVCSNAWGSYVNGSLRSLIETGRGRPNKRETAESRKTSR
jgi:hypothetical protein